MDHLDTLTDTQKREIALKKYYTIEDPASFGGQDRLYRAMRPYGWKLKDVKSFLNDQNAYILHRERRYKFPRNKIITYHKDYQHQMDLIDMQEYKRQNDGYAFILIVIDCFTRFIWHVPLKDKRATTIKASLEELYTAEAPLPLRVQTDRGKEFIAALVKEWFEQHGIHFFTTQGTGFKCAYVERANRTLKYKMFRVFAKNGSYRWIGQMIKDLISSYNKSYHRMIGMTPEEARTKMPNELPMNMTPVEALEPKFNPEDTVRIAYDKNKMDRGYWKTHYDHVYRINRVLREGEVPVYEIRDYYRKVLPRRFYREELAPVGDIIYAIDKIHRRRVRNGVREILVTWVGYRPDDKYWIKESDVRDGI